MVSANSVEEERDERRRSDERANYLRQWVRSGKSPLESSARLMLSFVAPSTGSGYPAQLGPGPMAASPHGAPPLPPSSAAHSRDVQLREQRERDASAVTTGNASTSGSGGASPGAAPGAGGAAGNASLANLSDLDPDDVPRELKKEGSDWLAIFNPKVKRVLDVNLVHTLMHER